MIPPLVMASKSIGSSVIKWTGSCNLPKKMSWSEFSLFQQESLMDVPYMNKIEKHYMSEGKILKVYTVFNGSNVTWTYVFKNFDSYKKWSNKTSKGLKPSIHTLVHSYDCNVQTVPFWDIDWFHPKDKDISKIFI